nr:MAG TPA: hypothetical protein [Caudoviricetes sp.]
MILASSEPASVCLYLVPYHIGSHRCHARTGN